MNTPLESMSGTCRSQTTQLHPSSPHTYRCGHFQRHRSFAYKFSERLSILNLIDERDRKARSLVGRASKGMYLDHAQSPWSTRRLPQSKRTWWCRLAWVSCWPSRSPKLSLGLHTVEQHTSLHFVCHQEHNHVECTTRHWTFTISKLKETHTNARHFQGALGCNWWSSTRKRDHKKDTASKERIC